jgi:hypothetical protein
MAVVLAGVAVVEVGATFGAGACVPSSNNSDG